MDCICNVDGLYMDCRWTVYVMYMDCIYIIFLIYIHIYLYYRMAGRFSTNVCTSSACVTGVLTNAVHTTKPNHHPPPNPTSSPSPLLLLILIILLILPVFSSTSYSYCPSSSSFSSSCSPSSSSQSGQAGCDECDADLLSRRGSTWDRAMELWTQARLEVLQF
jgi:hypothetical protein